MCFGDLKYEAQHSIQDWKMRPKNSKQIILKCWDAEPWYAAKAHEHSSGAKIHDDFGTPFANPSVCQPL